MPLIAIPTGIATPNVLKIPLLSSPGGLDLTTLTGVSLTVLRPDQTTATWTATIDGGATAMSATGSYAFAAGGADVTQKGIWYVAIDGVLSGGTLVPFEPRRFQVVDPFGRS